MADNRTFTDSQIEGQNINSVRHLSLDGMSTRTGLNESRVVLALVVSGRNRLECRAIYCSTGCDEPNCADRDQRTVAKDQCCWITSSDGITGDPGKPPESCGNHGQCPEQPIRAESTHRDWCDRVSGKENYRCGTEGQNKAVK